MFHDRCWKYSDKKRGPWDRRLKSKSIANLSESLFLKQVLSRAGGYISYDFPINMVRYRFSYYPNVWCFLWTLPYSHSKSFWHNN